MSEQQGDPIAQWMFSEQKRADKGDRSRTTALRREHYLQILSQVTADFPEFVDPAEVERVRSLPDDAGPAGFLESLNGNTARVILSHCGMDSVQICAITHAMDLQKASERMFRILCGCVETVERRLPPLQQLRCREEWTRATASFVGRGASAVALAYCGKYPPPSAEEWERQWFERSLATFDFCARWLLETVEWGHDHPADAYDDSIHKIAKEIVQLQESEFKLGAGTEIALALRISLRQADAFQKQREWMEAQQAKNEKAKRKKDKLPMGMDASQKARLEKTIEACAGGKKTAFAKLASKNKILNSKGVAGVHVSAEQVTRVLAGENVAKGVLEAMAVIVNQKDPSGPRVEASDLAPRKLRLARTDADASASVRVRP